MEKEIFVRVGKAYGREHYYPSCDFSRLLCGMLGMKSLTAELVKSLVDFGFRVFYQGDDSKILKDEFGAIRK